ncbi:MAG: protein kinase [Pirellulaceae bacterium]
MEKIKTVQTTAEFLSLVEKSGLLVDEQIAKAREVGKRNQDPTAVARELLKNGWLTKWQAAQLLAGFFRLRIGNYRLCDQIGKGEMGRVYLAEHAKLGKQVAVKALSPRHTAKPDSVKRFLREAQAASALEHENIVHVQDVSSEGDRHFIVMEYVQGKDLQQRVKDEGPLAFRDVAHIVRQAAEGLSYAHKQGIVHADLKPANLLVDDQGAVKILDMGVGQLRQAEKTSKENTGDILLSAISYMSPEQARGLDADARSDVYALGGTMYYMLTGRVPFAVGTDEERRTIRETKRPIPIQSLRDDTPDPLAGTCQKMMAIRRDSRLASMQAVIDSLQKEPATPPKRPKKKKQKNAFPLSIVLAIAGAVCIVLGLAVTLFLVLRPGKETPAVAQGDTEAATGSAVDPELETEDIEDVEDIEDIEDIEDQPEVDIEDVPDPEMETVGGDNRQTDEAVPSDSPAKPIDPGPTAGSTGPGTAPEAPTDSNGGAQSKPEETMEGPAADVQGEQPVTGAPPVETPAVPEPEQPVPAPESSKPKPKPAQTLKKKAPPAKTFVFHAAEDLPPLPSAEGGATSKVLGKINIQPQDACFISMMGGESAVRGRSTFTLRNANGGTALRDWEIVLNDPAGGDMVIATLGLPQSDLTFAWSAAAADQSSANHLRNCSLRITAGQDKPQELQLRMPASVPPITIDLERPEMSARWNLEAPPNPASIRIETTVEGHPYALEPPQPIGAVKGEQWVFFGENRQLSAVALQVEVNVKARGVQVTATPYFMVPGVPQPMPLTKPNMQQFETTLRSLKAREVPLKNLVKGLEKAPREKRVQVQNRLAQARLELQALEEGSQREVLLRATRDAVNGKAKLKFRVFYDTLDKQVDLLITNAPSEPVVKKGKR